MLLQPVSILAFVSFSLSRVNEGVIPDKEKKLLMLRPMNTLLKKIIHILKVKNVLLDYVKSKY